MPEDGPTQLPLLLITFVAPTFTQPPKTTLALMLAVPVTVKEASGDVLLTPTLLLVASTNKTPLSKLELPPKFDTLPESVTLACTEFPVTTKALPTPGLTTRVLIVAVLDTIKFAAVPTLTPKLKTLALLAYRSQRFVVSPSSTLLVFGMTLAKKVDCPETDNVLLSVALFTTLIVVALRAQRCVSLPKE
jgi:hypothetical protein